MTIRQFYLLKLSEECAEVAQRAAKQMQFGADEQQAQGPSSTKIELSNAQRLRAEFNDLLGVAHILIELGELPSATLAEQEEAMVIKRAKLAKYLAYSQSLKQVEV